MRGDGGGLLKGFSTCLIIIQAFTDWHRIAAVSYVGPMCGFGSLLIFCAQKRKKKQEFFNHKTNWLQLLFDNYTYYYEIFIMIKVHCNQLSDFLKIYLFDWHVLSALLIPLLFAVFFPVYWFLICPAGKYLFSKAWLATYFDLPHSQLRNSKVLRTRNRAQLAFLMVATRTRTRNFSNKVHK